jgi:hypothetical protein
VVGAPLARFPLLPFADFAGDLFLEGVAFLERVPFLEGALFLEGVLFLESVLDPIFQSPNRRCCDGLCLPSLVVLSPQCDVGPSDDTTDRRSGRNWILDFRSSLS